MSSNHDSLQGFDLNLLRVLDVLLRTRGVTRAAAELGLTQSGVSRALRRLRDHFGDPLLVRRGRQMVPTAVALELAAPVGRLLADAELLFVSGRGFDPATAQWTVRIGSPDYSEHILLPGLLERVMQTAPGVDVHMVHTRVDPEPLLQGRVDFMLGVSGVLDGPDLVATHLFDDTLCCVVRADHPVVRTGLDLDRYLALDHILIAPGGRPGGPVDTALARLGRPRRVRAQVSGFTSPLPLLARTDSIVTMLRRFAEPLAAPWGLALLPPPIELPGFSMSSYWPAHRRTEPAHRWFRGVLEQTAAGLRALSSRTDTTPPPSPEPRRSQSATRPAR